MVWAQPMKKRALIVLFFFSCLLTYGQSPASGIHYVAPNGSSTGDGSLSRPWDLQTALNQPATVKPGDIIWVRAGTYGGGSTIFYSRLVGTAAAPIVVRGYPGERATINGWLQVGCCDQNPQPNMGSYVWFWGLEFSSSITDRTGGADGSSAILDGVDTWALGSKFINNIVHDTRNGFGMWQEGPDAEAYGNIVYFNGFQGPDRGHGHGFYVQNNTGTKTISNNIIFDQFDNGMQFYGSSASNVKNIVVQGNVSFNNGALAAPTSVGLAYADDVVVAIGSGAQGIQLLNNYFYFTPSLNLGNNELGWTNPNVDMVCRGNYFMGGFEAVALGNWSSVVFQNNTIYSRDKYEVLVNSTVPVSGFTWNNNTYYGSGIFQINGAGTFFSGWPAKSGLDSQSTFHSGEPTGVWTFVMPNHYEPGRANIVVYNWDHAASVALDVSGTMTSGARYEIVDAQNYFGPPVAAGTYDGKPISVPMTGLTVAVPNGNVATVPTHTSPEFAAFVLRPAARNRIAPHR